MFQKTCLMMVLSLFAMGMVVAQEKGKVKKDPRVVKTKALKMQHAERFAPKPKSTVSSDEMRQIVEETAAKDPGMYVPNTDTKYLPAEERANLMTTKIAAIVDLQGDAFDKVYVVNRQAVQMMDEIREKYQDNPSLVALEKKEIDRYRDQQMLQFLTESQKRTWENYKEPSSLSIPDNFSGNVMDVPELADRFPLYDY